MRFANILAGAAATVWLAMFLVGRDLIRGVYQQGSGVAPNAGQIDFYMVYPMVAVALLMFAGWVGNAFGKPLVTLIPSLLIGFSTLPFLLGYTGGM
jgi:hypothetical protein